MTFDANVPNAGQSPGLFPPQNNTNFARLKTIINADHVFNDTSQSTDGVHRQVTMIARASPSSLPAGTNSILYSKVDGSGQTQLFFYNGTLDVQMTPPQELFPIRIVVTVNVPAASTMVAYANPGFRYSGTAYASISGSSSSSFYNVIRAGTNDSHQIDFNDSTVNHPSVGFQGDDLAVGNNDPILARNIILSLIINRIS